MTPVERHCSSRLVFDPGVEQRSDVYRRLARKLPLITEPGIAAAAGRLTSRPVSIA